MVGLKRFAAIFGLFTSISLGATLRAGAAQTIVTPDLKLHGPVYMAGFGNNRVATGIHDDLYTRCFAIDAGGPRALILCAIDSIGIFLDDVDRIRAAVAKEVPRADVVIASTHVHQGPDSMGLWGPEGKTGINETYMSFLTAQAAHAAVNAYQSMTPARLVIAKTHPDELDTFIDDTRPPVRHDAELLAIRAIDSATGKTIATLINWANHPEALGSKNTLVTSDYVASLRTTVEVKLGGIAVYANGAIGGMQSPLGAHVPGDLKDGTFEKAIYIGRRVGEIAVDAITKAAPAAIDAIDYREQRINVPLANKGFEQAMTLNLYSGRKPLNKDGTTPSIVGAFRLTNRGSPVLECALIPGEMYPELSVGGVERYAGADFPDAPIEKPIKQMMTAPYRMLFGLANDEIGYIIPKAEWDNQPPWLNGAKDRWYGEVNSVGPDVAPTIANAVEKLFH